ERANDVEQRCALWPRHSAPDVRSQIRFVPYQSDDDGDGREEPGGGEHESRRQHSGGLAGQMAQIGRGKPARPRYRCREYVKEHWTVVLIRDRIDPATFGSRRPGLVIDAVCCHASQPYSCPLSASKLFSGGTGQPRAPRDSADFTCPAKGCEEFS